MDQPGRLLAFRWGPLGSIPVLWSRTQVVGIGGVSRWSIRPAEPSPAEPQPGYMDES